MAAALTSALELNMGRKLRQLRELKSEFNAELWRASLHRLLKSDSGNVNLCPMKKPHTLQ